MQLAVTPHAAVQAALPPSRCQGWGALMKSFGKPFGHKVEDAQLARQLEGTGEGANLEAMAIVPGRMEGAQQCCSSSELGTAMWHQPPTDDTDKYKDASNTDNSHYYDFSLGWRCFSTVSSNNDN